MLWIFIIIFIMNILCESHIDVYIYEFSMTGMMKHRSVESQEIRRRHF